MKRITKLSFTLAIGIGMLVGTSGIASASPHYTNWGGKVVMEQPDKPVEAKALAKCIPVQTKSQVSNLKPGLGLHDSVHCLHNNGAFLPWHRG